VRGHLGVERRVLRDEIEWDAGVPTRPLDSPVILRSGAAALHNELCKTARLLRRGAATRPCLGPPRGGAPPNKSLDQTRETVSDFAPTFAFRLIGLQPKALGWSTLYVIRRHG
jgi:hypothetical protein